MNLILNIDTAIETASLCLANEGFALHLVENTKQKDHAGWIHLAIQKLMQNAGYRLQDLSAIALSAGPGSYTGLRAGMATAKGLCYALNIPLIAIGTLKMMANAAAQSSIQKINDLTLLCPMIDARRMEVFTALYNKMLDEISKPEACVLGNASFTEFLDNNNKILFFGNGSAKFQNFFKHPNAFFTDITSNASHIVPLSYQAFTNNIFADLVYAEPYYTKAFYNPAH